jgi:protein gp37
MGKDSAITWCHGTFNPWWGCTFVGGSPACAPADGQKGAVCYAKTWDARTGGDHWGADKPRRFFSDKHWAEPVKWDRLARESGERRRNFCMSMGDIFEGRPDQESHRERLWNLIRKTEWTDWLLLTKRPQLIESLYPEDWLIQPPPPDVWLGTTTETQYWLDLRWDFLRRIPAAVYWLSVEPLFEPVVLPADFLALGPKAWCVVGGQSGSGAVPMNPDWVRWLRDQCLEAGVPFHFKQWGEHNDKLVRIGKKQAGRELDGRIWDEFPIVA